MTGAARFPAVPRGLGVGLDLQWGAPAGFATDATGRDRVSPRVRGFLAGQGARFDHVFFSWQPRDRGRLRLDDYAPAWDDLFASVPAGRPRALHHTALDLAALEAAPEGRRELLDFTNALCARYEIGWINEDVGFWSLSGRPLPYPLPPLLDATGLRACVRNVRACQRGLEPPLVLEFPGFAAGVSLVLGEMDAYDFFRALAEETGAPVNLDVAHLLSWRWWRGLRNEDLFADLERLPLEACFEVHLSGCEIVGDRFIDAHHGRLLDEQLTMLERLMPLCPNLRAITFEDPRLDEAGVLEPDSARSLARLRGVVGPWAAVRPPGDGAPERAARGREPEVVEISGATERTLGALLYDRGARAAWRRREEPAPPFTALDPGALEEAAAAVRIMVRERRHRGTGRLEDTFARSVAGWRRLHPADAELDELFARFLAAPAVADWREVPGALPGDCIEACFAAFLVAEGIADAATVEDELCSGLLRSLAVTLEPSFRVPPEVRRVPGGWLAITTRGPPILHAAVGGAYLRGEVTPVIVALLEGASIDEVAARYRVAAPAAQAVGRRLGEMGLLVDATTGGNPR